MGPGSRLSARGSDRRFNSVSIETMETAPYSAIAQGGLWTVTYTEPSGSLKLSFELGIDKPILWVPTEERWAAQMPQWAQGRRDEIVERAVRCAFGSNGVILDSL
jgi:hypothetical protein